MASNDTNSWDKDPHEQMRQRWQQAFDDHRMEARPALTRRVFNALNAQRRRRVYWLVGGLLFWLGAWLVYFLLSGNAINPGSAPIATLPAPATTPARESAPALQRTDVRTEPNTARRPLPALTSSRENQGASSAPVATRSRVSKALHSARQPVPVFASTETRSVRNVSPPAAPGTAVPGLNVPRMDIPRMDIPRMDIPGELAPGVAEGLKDSRLPAVVWQILQPVAMRSLPIGLNPLSRELNPLADAAQHPADLTINRRRWNWFAEVQVQSSFQSMTARSIAGAYLTSVKTPAAFAPETWGYQLSGGVRWQRWQAHLAVGQLRRWAYYTVQANEYRVEPTPGNPHRVVREASAVAENELLPLVGLGLSQQQVLNHGRYTVELGGQITYLPTNDQSLLSLRGGLFRRLLTTQRQEWQLGLRAEYGLNGLHNEHRHLSIHPLLIGIGLRIQPRLNP